MKTKLIYSLSLLPLLMIGAEQIFQVDFNNNNVKPTIAKGSKIVTKPVKLDPKQNLPEGIKGKALRNGSKPPLDIIYLARKNFSYSKGTISFWCKAPVLTNGKNHRLIHIYAPDTKNKSVLIYTFYISGKGEFIARNEISSTRENTSIKVASSEIKANTFFKIDVTWDGKLFSIYKDGELQDDADLPATYAKEATTPRGWSNIFVLKPFASLNDDANSNIIIDEIKCFNDALDSDAIQAAYKADLKK